jgi:ATP-binding cassette subfamily C (CFTR/MRP) protein 1
MHIAMRLMCKLRASLVTAIYKNMLLVRAESSNSSSALSLMSTDVDRLTMTTSVVVNLGPDAIQVALALWLLGTQLGATSVAPVILCVICAIIAARVAKLVPPRQKKWMAAIQKRVGITSNVIGAMKGVKVAGLSSIANQQIEGLRDFEIEQSVQFRKLSVATIMFGKPKKDNIHVL